MKPYSRDHLPASPAKHGSNGKYLKRRRAEKKLGKKQARQQLEKTLAQTLADRPRLRWDDMEERFVDADFDEDKNYGKY